MFLIQENGQKLIPSPSYQRKTYKQIYKYLKMKKNIIFFADSSVDLINLYKVLKSKFNIIWIVYYEDVYNFLKREDIEKVYLLNPSSKIFNKKNIVTKLIKYFISLLGIKFGYTKLYRDLKDIEKQYSPVIFLTDSSMILANYKTESIKICTQHTVAFKNTFYMQIL